MANFKPSKAPEPIEISRYLGINEAVGETEIEIGQATKQINWRITQNYKPQKRTGHKTWWDFGNTKNVQGVWEGTVGAKHVLIAINDGKVYERDLSVSTAATTTADLITATAVTQVGTMTDAKTTIFYFESNLYFLNGTEYKQYDGTTFADADPYVPTVAIGTPPAGGGTPFEPINLLTGKKKQEFFADGVLTRHFIAERKVDSIDHIEIDLGKLLGDSTTQYSITNPSGKTFRYTWDTVGTDPLIDTLVVANCNVYINAQNFNLDNNGVFRVTAKGVNYFEVYNLKGVVEPTKTIGTGSIGATSMYQPSVNFAADTVEGVVDTFPIGTPLGDSTTQYNITNPTGTTFRYTWTTVGTDPLINTTLAVNDCIQILAENFNSFNNGIFKVTAKGVNYFEIVNALGVKETAKTIGAGLIRTTLGDETTGFSITNTSGDTYRYTYDLGTAPLMGTKLVVNDWLWINAQNFNANNNGKFKVTAKAVDYFEITNVNGIVEATKTLGLGFLNKASTTGEPLGVVADETTSIVQWTKIEAGNADLVKKNKYATINGPGNDTAVFLWGNPSAKNRRSWSGTLKANYFPVINYTLIGSNEYDITDIKPQYDRQIIFKKGGKTHFSYPEWNTTAMAWDYPVYDLNDKIGNDAFGQVQIVKNNPVSLHGQSWHEWTSTTVKDERNENVISERLRISLAELDISTAITFDNQREKEYWCNVGSNVYIWNYGNDTMYTYDNISGTCFLDIGGLIYYGSQGTMERVEGLNDNGVAIAANLELGFTDFGVNHLLKNTRKIWVTIQPENKTSLDVLYTTNKNFLSDVQTISVGFTLLDFDALDFDNFSFETNRAPQSFRKKIRAKKYSYIKFSYRNDKVDESVIILAIKLTADTTSEVK